MGKTIPLLLLFIFGFLTGCEEQVICSTPYILSEGSCCLDSDADLSCDPSTLESQETPPQPSISEPPLSTPASTVLVKPYQVSYASLIDDDPSLGPAGAPIVLVHFGKYQDTHSQRFFTEVFPAIRDAYGSQVKYVFRDFPGKQESPSWRAAQAATCANEQNAFWAYHELLYSDINSLYEPEFMSYAQQLNLNINTFLNCYQSKRSSDEVRHDINDAYDRGVSSTPTFFLNGERIVGFKDFAFFDQKFRTILRSSTPPAPLQQAKRIYANSQSDSVSLIRKGPAALDPTISSSPYTNTIDLARGTFYTSAVDAPKGDDIDFALFTSKITIQDFSLHTETSYNITFTTLVDTPPGAGVRTNIFLYGNSGRDTPLLPKTKAFLSLTGYVDIKEKDVLIIHDAPAQFVVVHGIRDNGKLTPTADPEDYEAYLFIPNIPLKASTALPLSDGFLYFFWEDVSTRQT